MLIHIVNVPFYHLSHFLKVDQIRQLKKKNVAVCFWKKKLLVWFEKLLNLQHCTHCKKDI